MSTETKTRETLKSDADWNIIQIRVQMTTALHALKRTDECQAVIRGTLRDTTPPIPPAWVLRNELKDIVDQTRTLKSSAGIIHEYALKLDRAITQLEALEKETEK